MEKPQVGRGAPVGLRLMGGARSVIGATRFQVMASAWVGRAHHADLAGVFSSLGAQEVVAVEALQDVVGNPGADVAVGCRFAD